MSKHHFENDLTKKGESSFRYKNKFKDKKMVLSFSKYLLTTHYLTGAVLCPKAGVIAVAGGSVPI